MTHRATSRGRSGIYDEKCKIMRGNSIWVIRHGETIWNQEGRLQGQFDSQLTEQAKCHLAKLELPVSAPLSILCSDLGRAVETAQLIQQYHQSSHFIASPLLRERHFGVLQGQIIKPPSTLDEQWQYYHNRNQHAGLAIEGCEADEAFEHRLYQAKKWILDVAEQSPAVIVIVHGEWWRAFENILSNRPIWHAGVGIIANSVLHLVSCEDW